MEKLSRKRNNKNICLYKINNVEKETELKKFRKVFESILNSQEFRNTTKEIAIRITRIGFSEYKKQEHKKGFIKDNKKKK